MRMNLETQTQRRSFLYRVNTLDMGVATRYDIVHVIAVRPAPMSLVE